MSDRTERARYLGEQLTALMSSLGNATRGPEVMLFFDTLARLEAWPAGELAEVPGLIELVAEAGVASAEHADALARVAGLTIDLDQLLHTGRHLPEADDSSHARDAWLRDVLMLATVTPRLTAARRQSARWALEKANAMVEAHAERFLDASALVWDRRTLEAPEALGEDARRFLAVLAELPLRVAFDRSFSRVDPRRVAAALQRVDRQLLAVAEDALADHDARGELRLPGVTERSALAAADITYLTLVRMEAGSWVMSRQRGRVTLGFERVGPPHDEDPDVGVGILDGPWAGAVPMDEHGAFTLPISDESLRLRLRVGPDSRVLRLDGSRA